MEPNGGDDGAVEPVGLAPIPDGPESPRPERDAIVGLIEADGLPYPMDDQERRVIEAEVDKRLAVERQITDAALNQHRIANEKLVAMPRFPDRTVVIYTDAVGTAVEVPEVALPFQEALDTLFETKITPDAALPHFDAVTTFAKRPDGTRPITYHYKVRACEFTIEFRAGTPSMVNIRTLP